MHIFGDAVVVIEKWYNPVVTPDDDRAETALVKRDPEILVKAFEVLAACFGISQSQALLLPGLNH